MDNVIVGMFDQASGVDSVVRDLEGRGIPRSRIQVEEERAASADTKQRTLQELSVFQQFGDTIPGRERATYAEGVRRGHTLVTATVEDGMVDDAVAVMRSHGAIDIDERSAEWRSQGWRTQLTEFDDDDTASTPPRHVEGEGEGEATFPVVEEQLRVGKREVSGGGVRVYSHVTERPVEEQVQLREEHVVVDRRPVDRAVDANEPGLFEEGSFELTERSEEAVVGKDVRVVEEVVVGKQASQREETVRGTVRRTDVDVEQVSGERAAGSDTDDHELRAHHQRRFGSSGTYDEYAPAYQYGRQLAGHEGYRGRSWDEISPQAQRAWEASRPGTWERFQEAIRYGWQRLTGGGDPNPPRH